MKVLLAEYTVLSDPALCAEGAAMLSALKRSFEQAGHIVEVPVDKDLGSEILRLGPHCDAGLVIAPDHLLAGFTRLLEQVTWNIGCGSLNIAVCANKRLTASILSSHGIDIPVETTRGKKVLKPVSGCGSQGVRLSDETPGPGEIGQEYINGEPLSVSLVGSRVVGDVCECFTGRPPLVLAINRQKISMKPDGTFVYEGGETPVLNHPLEEQIIQTAIRTASVLGCQGYVGIDMVVGDRIVVVDVNPRITTSVVGITSTMEEELSTILIGASYGKGPDKVHHHGHVVFDREGRIHRI